MRYFIISQPKAGTYLLANVFKNLGIEHSRLHFDPGLIRKFNALKDYEKVSSSPESVLKKELKPNQFAVGHIPCDSSTIGTYSSVKKVLITRDRKDIQRSAKRYLDETGLDVHSIINDENLDKIEAWKDVEGVFHITFEDIIHKDIDKIDELQEFLFGKVIYNSDLVIEKSLADSSMTKSSIR